VVEEGGLLSGEILFGTAAPPNQPAWASQVCRQFEKSKSFQARGGNAALPADEALHDRCASK